MHIAVIGSGYVGLVTGACFAEFGVDVTCVDVDADKIAQLSRGQATIYEPGLDQLLQKNLQAGRLRFTTDLQSAVEPASAEEIANPVVEGSVHAVAPEEALDPVQASSPPSTPDDETREMEGGTATERSTLSTGSSMTIESSEDPEGQTGQTS